MRSARSAPTSAIGPYGSSSAKATGLAFMAALREGWRPPHPKTGAPQEPFEDGRGPAGVNRIMQRLRHFINWCRNQQPQRLTRSPFHRYGIQIKLSDEVQRTRRLHEGEEAALLAACDAINTLDHKFAGPAIKRRLLGTLWLGARGSELDRVQLADINFRTWDVQLRKGKSAPRAVWLDARSPLRALLEQRRFLKPGQFVFGDDAGALYNARSARGRRCCCWPTGRSPSPARAGRRSRTPCTSPRSIYTFTTCGASVRRGGGNRRSIC